MPWHRISLHGIPSIYTFHVTPWHAMDGDGQQWAAMDCNAYPPKTKKSSMKAHLTGREGEFNNQKVVVAQWTAMLPHQRPKRSV